MIKIVIIGSGNVAQHLITAFKKSSEIEVSQAFARKKESLTHLLNSNKICSDYNELVDADLYIIAVSDDAILDVASKLSFENQLVVHTSGSSSLDALNNKNRKGVFYPLQTFSKNKAIDFSTVPMCLESDSPSDYALLEKVAQAISNKVFPINSEQRKALHISAVFVSNFTNHLYQIGNEICEENQVSFEVLKPLILETANKVLSLSPAAAQTGPAIRNDQKTISAHLNSLSNENHKNIYKILTQSIQNNGKKL